MENQEVQTARGRILMAGLLMMFTLVLMISFYLAYNNQDQQREGGLAQENLFGDERGQNVSLEEVMSDPDSFVGQVVSVRGEVKKNLGTRGLTVETSGIQPDELLVVSRESLVGVGGGPGEALYSEKDGVRVSGVVRTFFLEELEAEIGEDLNEEAYREYEGKPVVIADSITPLQNQ